MKHIDQLFHIYVKKIKGNIALVGSVVIGHLKREGIGYKIDTSNQLLQLQYKEVILLTNLTEPGIVSS